MAVDVSVCIPVYNEKGALKQTVDELRTAMQKLPYSFEIIVIDDGSTDDCLSSIRGSGVRIVRHRRNFGGGVARLTGLYHAKGKWILQTDADGTYPVDAVPELLSRLQNAELVIAARRRESATDFRVLRVFMKWILKTLASVLAGHKIPDLNSGMRAYHKDMALRYSYLYPRGHSIMSTMTLAFLAEGLKVEFVPIDYHERIGKSSFRPIRDTYNYAVTIIRTLVYFDPLRQLMPVAGFFATTAVLATARDIYTFLHIGNLALFLWFCALLVVAVAVLSDQFSRMSRQITFTRPDFWIYGANTYEE